MGSGMVIEKAFRKHSPSNLQYYYYTVLCILNREGGNEGKKENLLFLFYTHIISFVCLLGITLITAHVYSFIILPFTSPL